MGGNQQVVQADGAAGSLKLITDLAIVPGSGLFQRKHIYGSQDRFHLVGQSLRAPTFSAVTKFGSHNHAGSETSGFEPGSSFGNFPLRLPY